jgi:hypothetical protein
MKTTQGGEFQNAEALGHAMRRILKHSRWRIGGLVAVACLAGLNLARIHANHETPDVVGFENISFDNEMFGGRYNSLYIKEGPFNGDWVAATDHLERIHSLHVDNLFVTEEQIVRFLVRHPELRDLDIEPVWITEKGAKQIGHCRSLRTVTFSGRRKQRVDPVAVDKLIEERTDLTVYGYHDLIGCGPFTEP